jgi:hypothetical protein
MLTEESESGAGRSMTQQIVAFVAAGETFYYSGKNCWHPKGQTRLVIPTAAVFEACDICSENNGPLPLRPRSYVCSVY